MAIDFPRSYDKPFFPTDQSLFNRPKNDDQLFKSKILFVLFCFVLFYIIFYILNLEERISNKTKHSIKLKKNAFTTSYKSVGIKNRKNKVLIEQMTLSRLIENIIIYGCVQEISDFEIKFSVTGGIVIKVPITNITRPYAKLIENFANEQSENIEIAKLCTIFQIGDYFPIKILSKQICDQFGHAEVIGSINPIDIYSNLTL